MRRLALALTLALGATVLAAPAHAQTYKVPRRATITITGHGYGHGHGMSQYGARGAAEQGLDAKEIADFYYPGTAWGKAAGKIRVLLGSDTTDDLVVLAAKGLTLRSALGPEVLPDNGATRWRFLGGTVSWFDGSWHEYSRIDGDAGFSVARAPVSVVLPSGVQDYRGQVWSRLDDGDRVTVNRLGMRSYLRGVVPLEMPALWEPAAVQAQAIAARTYAAYDRAHPRSTVYDICDTWSCQVYGGVAAEHPASDAAVAATGRAILTNDGEPAFTPVGSSSGGWSTAGSMPYLPAQADPYDDVAANPMHDWSVKVTDRTLERAWPAIGNLRRIVVDGRDGGGDWGGRLTSLTLVGGRGRVTMSGDTFRAVLGLRSTYLSFRLTTG
jgi:SpoIID/LytB domain protein